MCLTLARKPETIKTRWAREIRFPLPGILFSGPRRYGVFVESPAGELSHRDRAAFPARCRFVAMRYLVPDYRFARFSRTGKPLDSDGVPAEDVRAIRRALRRWLRRNPDWRRAAAR